MNFGSSVTAFTKQEAIASRHRPPLLNLGMPDVQSMTLIAYPYRNQTVHLLTRLNLLSELRDVRVNLMASCDDETVCVRHTRRRRGLFLSIQ